MRQVAGFESSFPPAKASAGKCTMTTALNFQHGRLKVGGVHFLVAAMAARKGSTDHLRFGVPDTAPLKPTDLSAREISITLSMIYAVSFFEGQGMGFLEVFVEGFRLAACWLFFASSIIEVIQDLGASWHVREQ